MPKFEVNEAQLAQLEGKVVVLTGGANGIGRCLVKSLHGLGAHVFFGDINQTAAASLVAELNDSPGSLSPKVFFQRTDVSSYADNLSLFDAALSACGRIDHAVSVAGLMERENIVSPALDLETVKTPPTGIVLDVNLLSAIYFARIAAVYLRQNQSPENSNRSITLFSSISGFNDSPGMYMYAAAKHGILGFMRAARRTLPVTHGIRINALCPWYTDTEMTVSIREGWRAAGLPINRPEDVAFLVTGVMVDSHANGKAIFVGGGQGWDIEEGINSLRPQWLGVETNAAIERARSHLGTGGSWTKGSQSDQSRQ